MSQQDYISKRNAALTELFEALKPHGDYELSLTYGLISDKQTHMHVAGWVMNKLAWYNNARNRRDGFTTAVLPVNEIVSKLLELRRETLKKFDVQAMARARSRLAYDFLKILEAEVNGSATRLALDMPLLRVNYSSAVNYANDVVTVDVCLETKNVAVKVVPAFKFEAGTSNLKEVTGTKTSGVSSNYKVYLGEVRSSLRSFVANV